MRKALLWFIWRTLLWPSFEVRRGSILFVWALTIPDLSQFSGYATLEVLLSWTGAPALFLSALGLATGAAQVYGYLAGVGWVRRASAIVATSVWLLIASGFFSPHAATSALIIYLGMAWLNVRTAWGLPAK